MSTVPLRARLSAALDPEMRAKPGLSLLNRIVIWAILAMILLGILETEMPSGRGILLGHGRA